MSDNITIIECRACGEKYCRLEAHTRAGLPNYCPWLASHDVNADECDWQYVEKRWNNE